MVALSPRFTVLTALCVLAALSSAPISDAAVLPLSTLDPALTNVASGHRPRSHSSHAADHPPVLPLPKGPGGSYKDYEDSGNSPTSSGNKGDQKIPHAGGSHGEKDASAGDEDKGSSYDDNGTVHVGGGKVKVRIFGSHCPPLAIVLINSNRIVVGIRSVP